MSLAYLLLDHAGRGCGHQQRGQTRVHSRGRQRWAENRHAASGTLTDTRSDSGEGSSPSHTPRCTRLQDVALRLDFHGFPCFGGLHWTASICTVWSTGQVQFECSLPPFGKDQFMCLGIARLGARDPARARFALIEALELSGGLDQWENMRTALQRDTLASGILTWTLEALAALAVAIAHHENGALLFGAAEGVRRSIGGATWVPNRQAHEATRAGTSCGARRRWVPDEILRGNAPLA